jgi:N-acetylglutamate synthase-like GNAT family acetyltransferase
VSEPLFTIRLAEERDIDYLRMICDESGLGFIETVSGSMVAVNDEDLPVGFIHIETIGDDANPAANGAYVYPVAVFEAWQHHGVATALVEHALEASGELRLVACKPSQGFYPQVGFEKVDWDIIARHIARDCDRCVARESCAPIPFRLKKR